MPTLPAEFTKFIRVFACLFSNRVWRRVPVWLAGAILATGRRTVGAVLRAMGLSEERQFQAFHRLLNRAVWSSRAASHRLRLMLEVVIEVPRGSFLKRGATGRVDFVSPLPCPFNYGSVPNFLGLEGDLLDALVLGPRLPFGTRLRVRTWGAVTLTDRGMSDDKLIGDRPRRTLARAVAGATDPLLIEQRLLIGDGSLHHGDPPRFTFVVCLLNDPKARLGKPAMDALLLGVAKR